MAAAWLCHQIDGNVNRNGEENSVASAWRRKSGAAIQRHAAGGWRWQSAAAGASLEKRRRRRRIESGSLSLENNENTISNTMAAAQLQRWPAAKAAALPSIGNGQAKTMAAYRRRNGSVMKISSKWRQWPGGIMKTQ
jgi:hypothetical protein